MRGMSRARRCSARSGCTHTRRAATRSAPPWRRWPRHRAGTAIRTAVPRRARPCPRRTRRRRRGRGPGGRGSRAENGCRCCRWSTGSRAADGRRTGQACAQPRGASPTRADRRSPRSGSLVVPSVHRRLLICCLLAVLGLGSPLVSAGASADDAIPRPNNDPFYSYDGAKPLSRIAPGTPLATRDVTLAITQNGTPLPAEQILYRTTDATGKAVPSVTTVILPASGTANPRLVAYLSFYDALSNKCSP